MNFNVLVTSVFKRESKRLIKKYKSLKVELLDLVSTLEVNPKQGTPLGNNCYKIRLSVRSKGKGKSGGARVITYVRVIEGNVYLLSIYDKSQKQNITDKELEELIKRTKLS